MFQPDARRQPREERPARREHPPHFGDHSIEVTLIAGEVKTALHRTRPSGLGPGERIDIAQLDVVRRKRRRQPGQIDRVADTAAGSESMAKTSNPCLRK